MRTSRSKRKPPSSPKPRTYRSDHCTRSCNPERSASSKPPERALHEHPPPTRSCDAYVLAVLFSSRLKNASFHLPCSFGGGIQCILLQLGKTARALDSRPSSPFMLPTINLRTTTDVRRSWHGSKLAAACTKKVLKRARCSSICRQNRRHQRGRQRKFEGGFAALGRHLYSGFFYNLKKFFRRASRRERREIPTHEHKSGHILQ